jgi:hypothetical protein
MLATDPVSQGCRLIRREVALLDRKKLGLNAQIFAQVKLSAHGRANLSEFSEAIRKFTSPGASVWAFALSG